MSISSDTSPYLTHTTNGNYDVTDLKVNNIVKKLKDDYDYTLVVEEGKTKRSELSKKAIWDTKIDLNKSPYTQTTVGAVVCTECGYEAGSASVNYGLQSYSNMGDPDDISGALRDLDKMLSGESVTQAQPVAAQQPSRYVAQDIPVSPGATTFIINVYPGGNLSTATATATPSSPQVAPAANIHVPSQGSAPANQPLPSTSGSTQTVDADLSKLKNDLEYAKTLKERLIKKVQEVQDMQNQIQVKIREIQQQRQKENDEKSAKKEKQITGNE